MQTTPISALGFPSSGGASADSPNSPTGIKNDFLKLLVAQIRQQDPLNPTDPTQFTSQLAQFSSLEQLVGINSVLGDQSKLQAAAIGAASASFIGKTAEVLSDKVQLQGGVAGKARFNQVALSASTKVNIYDASNRLVRTVDLGPTTSGEHDFQWDGLTDSGAAAADGIYRIEVKPVDASGKDIDVQLTTLGTVAGVKFVNGTVLLNVNGADYTLADLVSLGDTTAAPAAPSASSGSPVMSFLRNLLPF